MITMSTPAWASVRGMPGSSTVQTPTSTPLWSPGDAVGARVERGGTVGVQPGMTVHGRDLRGRRNTLAVRQPRGPQGRRLGARPVDGGQIERRHDEHAVVVPDRVDGHAHHRSVRVGIGLPRQALHLGVHDPAAARGERFVQRRELGPRRAQLRQRK